MQLAVIEQNGIRVLTTNQLADAYGTDAKMINRNFQRNTELFEQGKNFYVLSGERLRIFKNQNREASIKFCSILYLWTFEACLLHARFLRNVCESKVRKIATVFNINHDKIIIQNISSKEYEFEKLLNCIIPSEFQCLSQYQINNYRLDFYIPNANLIIEFDEQHHKILKSKDQIRESIILKLLPGNKIIRVNSNDIYSGLRKITTHFYSLKGEKVYAASSN